MNHVAVKHVVAGIPPLLFVALRFVVARLVVWCFVRVLEPRSTLKRGDLFKVLGAFGVALAQTAFRYGASMTSASNTGLVFATSPAWGMVLALATGRESPTPPGTVGAVTLWRVRRLSCGGRDARGAGEGGWWRHRR